MNRRALRKAPSVLHARRGRSLLPLWEKASRRGGRGGWFGLFRRYFALNRHPLSPTLPHEGGGGSERINRRVLRAAPSIIFMAFMRLPCR
jgi:hypothetical protein